MDQGHQVSKNNPQYHTLSFYKIRNTINIICYSNYYKMADSIIYKGESNE